MDDELTAESGLDALIALLDERGIEHYECVASECEATVYEDKAGNAHECWEGGTSGIVNIVISVTPNEALSVDDLNGVIRENAKLRKRLTQYGLFECVVGDPAEEFARLRREMHRLQRENAKLRAAVATAIRVQTVLCGDAYMAYCRESCPLHRPETDDCMACDVIRVASELGIEVS